LLGGSELKDLLTATLQQQYVQDQGELELKLGRDWKPVTVHNEPVTLHVLELPTLGVTQNFIVRFELLESERRLGSWQMPVSAHVWREVWVARTALRRGQWLSEADRGRERRDVLALREAYVGNENEEAGLELAENVPAGAPLLQRQLKPRTVVRRGQVVDAVLRDGAMAVSLKVEVLEDGASGQQVRVRNLQTKREFRGKVENEGAISVSL
jgi:flagella basal body P-ring formation protein FlgA